MVLFTDHYLAVKDSNKESVGPYLYLKKIETDKEYDEEILFKVRTRFLLIKFKIQGALHNYHEYIPT